MESGEQCDPGSRLGSPDCSVLCRSTIFEPPGLPFGPEVPPDETSADTPQIFSPRLHCKPADERKGYRKLAPAVVRYRIHLCRTQQGVDAFTTQQVRDVMAKATTEFARGGIVLEEESLVKFTENDCEVPLGKTDWSDALVANTPPGVLAVSFVNAISTSSGHFGVGGFCYFFGPICVNAGAYDSLVIHELGHFFGLAHTFECAYGIETAATCEDDGDMMCDTPPDRGPLGISSIASCEGGSLLSGSCGGSCSQKTCTDGSKPDAYNWMSYYDCAPGHFSGEQQDFMRCTLDYEMSGYNAAEPPDAVCGDTNDDGELTASDALAVLRAGVGVTSCATWMCDYDGSGLVSASDALRVLKAAVGGLDSANCPPAP